MARLLVISEDQLRSVVERAVTEAVNGIMRAATTMEVDLAESAPATEMTVVEPKQAVEGRMYRIGSTPGEFSYAGVIAKEVDEYEFEFAKAWSQIEDRIITSSTRARSSAIRSLDKDRRFSRIHDRPGVWFRRMDKTQPGSDF